MPVSRLSFLPLFEGNALRWIPDRQYLRLEYWVITGKRLHLLRPKTFNEKIQWLKLHDRKPIYRALADKYENRALVKPLLGEEHMVPLLGVWDCPDAIDWDMLPESFVLKCTKGYGGYVLCPGKSSLDRAAATATLSRTWNTDFYPRGREWAYGGPKGKIIAEELIDDGGGSRPADYKFFVMNGTVKCVAVSRSLGNRAEGCISFFGPDGTRAPFKRVDYPDYPGDDPMPACFEEMKTSAERIAQSADAVFLRVDFYVRNGTYYFSECTFYPCGGTMFLDPPEYDRKLGDLLDL